MTYPARENAHREVERLKRFPEHQRDPGGRGREIVKEISACPSCEEKLLDLGPHSRRETPPETKACPECGVSVAACPDPCGDWGCAWHSHLGNDCASERGDRYREKLARSAG